MYSRKLEWSNGTGSDLFAMRNAYKVWETKHNRREFGSKPEQVKAEQDFCHQNGLEIRCLHECHVLIKELKGRLSRLNLVEFTGTEAIRYNDQERAVILKVVLAGAFYPNYFVSNPNNNPIFEHDTFHALNSRDPRTTVFFSGFKTEHIRELYVKHIKDFFKGTVVDEYNADECVKVSFDKGSEKVFVTFDMNQDFGDESANSWEKHISIPGGIAPEVYKAVKMRKLRYPAEIHILRYERMTFVIFSLHGKIYWFFFHFPGQLMNPSTLNNMKLVFTSKVDLYRKELHATLVRFAFQAPSKMKWTVSLLM